MEIDNQLPQHQVSQNQVHRNRAIVLGLLLLLVAGIGYAAFVQSTAKGQMAPKAPYDPLSAEERESGLARINAIASASQVSAGIMDKDAVDKPVGDRQVVLMFERHHASKDAMASGDIARQGEGYIYNYDSDTLLRVLVDMEETEAKDFGAEITSAEIAGAEVIETVQDVQLPLIPAEKERVITLIRNDENAWKTLRDQFQTTTGSELTELSQLESKIMIFQADAMPNRVNEASRQCGRHRCAQVLLFTHDKIAFEMAPIVDLSTETIAQLFWVE